MYYCWDARDCIVTAGEYNTDDVEGWYGFLGETYGIVSVGEIVSSQWERMLVQEYFGGAGVSGGGRNAAGE